MRAFFLFLAVAPLLAGGILVHGHRGARSVKPENTLPAFEYAIAAGADVIELDLAVTKDNVLVVSHDPVLPENICQGPAGTRVIREMTLLELWRWDCGSLKNPGFPRQEPVAARVPSLEQVLALAPRGRFHFNIETKISAARPEYTPTPEEFARLLVEMVRKYKLQARTIVQSFDFRTLVAVKKLAPEIRLAALFSNDRPFLEAAKESGASIVAPHYRLVTREKVAEAHRANLQVVPWTPNEPAEWDRLIEAGVDAIITDDPAALIEHLRAKGLR